MKLNADDAKRAASPRSCRAHQYCKEFLPTHNAAAIQWILREELEYGDFDLANLTRTLKSLVIQGLADCSRGPIDMSGGHGFVERWFEQQRMKYWPTDLDLAAMRVQYKLTPEDYDPRFHNFFQRSTGLPELNMEEFRAYKALRAAIAD